MITLHASGNFNKTEKLLKNIVEFKNKVSLNKYGRQGVDALTKATPVDSGKTADSWDYTITYKDGDIRIDWTNSNVNKGINIAIILQYGHGTRNGGYVEGRDYINPAMRSVFDNIADAAWKEIVK